MGEKEIKHAEEREEEREIRAGSRAEQCSADERGSVCGGGGEQTRSARDSICSHALVLRLYKYLTSGAACCKNPCFFNP